MKKIQIRFDRKFLYLVDGEEKILKRWQKKFFPKNCIVAKEFAFDSESDFLSWVENFQMQAIKNAVFYFLKRKSYTAKNLEKKLLEQSFSQKNIFRILKQSKDLGWILDDECFVTEEIEKAKRQGYGRKKIGFNLVRKGIQKEFLEKILNQKFPLNLERKILEKLLEKRKQKKTSLLFFKQRGFSFELIEEQLFKNRYDQGSAERESHPEYFPSL